MRLPVFLAGALVLAGMSAANATEPTALSEAQLDTVTAGAFAFDFSFQGSPPITYTLERHKDAVQVRERIVLQYPNYTDITPVYHVK